MIPDQQNGPGAHCNINTINVVCSSITKRVYNHFTRCYANSTGPLLAQRAWGKTVCGPYGVVELEAGRGRTGEGVKLSSLLWVMPRGPGTVADLSWECGPWWCQLLKMVTRTQSFTAATCPWNSKSSLIGGDIFLYACKIRTPCKLGLLYQRCLLLAPLYVRISQSLMYFYSPNTPVKQGSDITHKELRYREVK